MSPEAAEVVSLGGKDSIAGAAGRAAAVLKRGGVLLYPTDTIYGLGCLAGDREAVRRIYEIKGKPETKPSLVLVDTPAMAERFAAEVPPAARALMEACWPGPLTIVLRAATGVPDALTAGTGRIGMRLPADDFCVAMVGLAGSPVVSTSANRAGADPSSRFDRLLSEFGDRVDLAVDGGERGGKPSTIADLSGGNLVVLREGALSAAILEGIVSGKP